MTKKRRGASASKPAAPPPLPRAGPPTNIRPAGPHEAAAQKKRDDAIREALRRLDVDDDAL